MPHGVMEEVINQTDTLFDYEVGMYTVNCSTVIDQPDLEFVINAITLEEDWRVPSRLLIDDKFFANPRVLDDGSTSRVAYESHRPT
ncbi:hypothetical protein KIN20_004823 [Parelaphostrongylus tenuis]|uniref:Uncharacterized protein n=1 Tax=Parelaphostrongylus tenuis TaxID=148309 RepID=A0AAD5MKI1_PARTN|nr:hypothetical protein KIN20_004823 [Parelaphostrongylus tenuis]